MKVLDGQLIMFYPVLCTELVPKHIYVSLAYVLHLHVTCHVLYRKRKVGHFVCGKGGQAAEVEKAVGELR